MPPKPPTGTLSAPPSVRLGQTFTVDASGSVDGPGGGGITKYHYNFGDGTTETSPNARATHSYHDLEGQPFMCRVTVTNKKGRSDTSPPVSVEVVEEQIPLPVDCQLSDWSEWSAWIDNGDGTETRTRTRTILVEPANGGAPCDHQEETETRDIVLPPVDCELGPEVITAVTHLEACQPDGFQAVEVAWTKEVLTPPANGGIECGPTSGTRIEQRACEYVPPVEPPIPGKHAYFDKWAADPRTVCARGMRTQADLDAMTPVRPTAPGWTIDLAVDAARATVVTNYPTNGNIAPILAMKHAPVAPGQQMSYVWDMLIPNSWSDDPVPYIAPPTGPAPGSSRPGSGVPRKTFQVSREEPGDTRWIETRLHNQKNELPVIAELDWRFYGARGPGTTSSKDPNGQGSDSIQPLLVRFGVHADKVTRFVLHLDVQSDYTYASLWGMDTDRPAIQIYDRIAFVTDRLVTHFEFEHGDSQQRAPGLPPEWLFYRNCFAILGVDPLELLDQPV